MGASSFFLKMDDGAEIYVRKWGEVKRPWAVLQLAHGMAEHIHRYDQLARRGNEEGIIVLGGDHRGHGRTGARSGLQGYFAPKDGFERVVDDLFSISRWSKEQFPQLPHYLLGHSMGSFLVRRYLQKYGETIQGAILMGSGGDPGWAAAWGRFIAKIQMRKDPTKPSRLLDRLAFGSFNRGLKDPPSKFAWLSRDEEEVQKYLEDPFCGFICSSGFFYDLFQGLTQIHKDNLIANIPKKTPLLVLSGAADPVGKRGRGVWQFVGQYKKQGLSNIRTIIYPQARHELLNETNKEEVLGNIMGWLREQSAPNR